MNEEYMKIAINESKKAFKKDEVPVGAVIVKNNIIVSKAHNLKETKKDPTQHAEMIAIKKACKKINDWRLNDCLLYVNLEPCTMCMAAIAESRIEKVICGTINEKHHEIVEIIAKENNVDLEIGVLGEESSKTLKDFFHKKR